MDPNQRPRVTCTIFVADQGSDRGDESIIHWRISVYNNQRQYVNSINLTHRLGASHVLVLHALFHNWKETLDKKLNSTTSSHHK